MIANATELALIDGWQRDFPLTDRPFALVGRTVGLAEADTIATFDRLAKRGVISRIGAVVAPRTVGASTLAAMQVPPQRLDEVAAVVSAEPMVSHHYAREHALNLWFVVAGPDQAAVATTLERIEQRTALQVVDLPLLKAYYLDLGFALAGERRKPEEARAAVTYRPDARDRRLLSAIEDGLPLVERPYHEAGQQIGLSEEDVIAGLRRLLETGVVSRFGCVVRHRALGYTANAMAVWNVPDAGVDAIAARFAGHPLVTLCYQRPRRQPDWPYNLFCMVHAKSRAQALAAIDELNAAADTALLDQAVLFSTRCFKQRGAVFSRPAGAH